MPATSRRQWIGFGVFVAAVVGFVIVAMGWLLQTFVLASCGC